MAKVEAWSATDGKCAEVLLAPMAAESEAERVARWARQEYTPEEWRERFAAMLAWEASCDAASGGRAGPESGAGSVGL